MQRRPELVAIESVAFERQVGPNLDPRIYSCLMKANDHSNGPPMGPPMGPDED